MCKYDIKEVGNSAKGRWVEILSHNGIDKKFLIDRNGPCPLCGGKDRFRWDNKNGDGGGYCHQCDLKGNGFALLGRWLNLTKREDLPKLLSVIADVIHSSAKVAKIDGVVEATSKRKYLRELALKIWSESLPLKKLSTCPANRYFANRGLQTPEGLSSLRVHSALEYRQDGKVIGKFPCLISHVKDVKGNFLGIHRIYITDEGLKAPVPAVKMALGAIDKGGIWLGEPKKILNITEGLETALAVAQNVGFPVWAAVSATNMKKLEVPECVKLVYIWADRDRNETGERAANELARRLYYKGVESIINIPYLPIPKGAKSVDWLDSFVELSRGVTYDL